MSLDYLSHFGLSADPFGKDISDAELWMPPSKQSLVEDLTDAMHARASALLTGEPGVGKTCVLRALRQALTPANFRLVYCQNATVGRRDFYRHLCIALGLAKVSTAGDLFMAVSAHVEDLAKERVCPVFLVDEAHLLPDASLEDLRLLTGESLERRSPFALILAGQPLLRERLVEPQHYALAQRIAVRISLRALTDSDVALFLDKHLRAAGATRNLFDPDAVTLLFQHSRGVPRILQNLALAALMAAAAGGKKLVDADSIQQALLEQEAP